MFHGSVSAEKKVWQAKKLEEERKNNPHAETKEAEIQDDSPPTIIIPPELAARLAEANVQTAQSQSTETENLPPRALRRRVNGRRHS